MAGVFKKSTSITGKWKEINVQDGEFYDDETGEIIPVAKILEEKYGNGITFSLTTSAKTEEEIE